MEGAKIRYRFCYFKSIFGQEIPSGDYSTTSYGKLKEEAFKETIG